MTAADERRDPSGNPDRPIDDADLASLELLASAWRRRDPLPDRLVSRITFAVALDEVYAEVASIQRQGAGEAMAGVRGVDVGPSSPGMSFSTSEVTMTIMTSPSGGGIRIDGWLTPDAAIVGLRLPGETRRHAPRHGRFWFDGVPRGHVQLFVEHDDGTRAMITPAVEL